MIDTSKYIVKGMPDNPREDHIVKATALNGHVKACAICSTGIVEEVLKCHPMSPVVTVALGRFMTGSLLLADNMKGDNDTQTTIIKSNGPIRGMTCVCDSKGNVRAYPIENDIDIKSLGTDKIKVSQAVGAGTLTIIRDIGLKEPYVGSVELYTGEIAEDFTYYLATSEQTPSIVALGVKLEQGKVLYAGGMMVQLMPGASEDDIAYIEKRAGGAFPDITFLMEEGFTPAQILDLFLGDPNITYLEAHEVKFQCNCSKSRFFEGLVALGKNELQNLSEDDNGIDTECHFCNRKYHFTKEEINGILNEKCEE